MDHERPRPDFSAVEAVLFDLDGTLVETTNRWAQVVAGKLSPLRRILPRLDTVRLGRQIVMSLEVPGNYAVSLAERLHLGGALAGISDRVRRSKGLATRGSSQLIPGSLELVQALSGHYRLAVVTTRARAEAYAFLQRAGLAGVFDAVVTREDVLPMKPHPAPVRRAAQLLGVPTARCLMVGDTTMDVCAGRRAGALTVAVLSGFGDRHELTRSQPDLILDTVAQLRPLLPGATDVPGEN
jgi:phosphoglycolate phosphatase-like HAD superfamily hydrolase